MEIPLFPLHTVLCPGVALPLHVFEPRYRLMIDRCLAASTPFGVVLIRSGREVGGGELAIAGVGTFAEIRTATRLPDGRYDLLVVGTGRFTIDSVDTSSEPYAVADVTPLEDPVGDEDRASELADRTMRRFIRYLQLLQPMEGESGDPIDVRVEVETEEVEPSATGEDAVDVDPDDPDQPRRRFVIPDDPVTLSHLLSGILQVDHGPRQRLLEAASAEERLVAIDRILDLELDLLSRRLRLFVPPADVPAVRRN